MKAAQPHGDEKIITAALTFANLPRVESDAQVMHCFDDVIDWRDTPVWGTDAFGRECLTLSLVEEYESLHGELRAWLQRLAIVNAQGLRRAVPDRRRRTYGRRDEAARARAQEDLPTLAREIETDWYYAGQPAVPLSARDVCAHAAWLLAKNARYAKRLWQCGDPDCGAFLFGLRYCNSAHRDAAHAHSRPVRRAAGRRAAAPR